MKTQMNNVILASASPRRKELLKNIFEDFDILPADVDENVDFGVSAEKYPEKLAEIKAEAVAREHKNSLVIGCDTVVICDGKIFGKPADKNEAVEMIKTLSGRTHQVITGCCLCYQGRKRLFSSVTEVEFYELTDEEILEYVEIKEPENTGSTAKYQWQDKAGGYGIQSAGMFLVKGIKGDYNNVVGLPVAELKQNLKILFK